MLSAVLRFFAEYPTCAILLTVVIVVLMLAQLYSDFTGGRVVKELRNQRNRQDAVRYRIRVLPEDDDDIIHNKRR